MLNRIWVRSKQGIIWIGSRRLKFASLGDRIRLGGPSVFNRSANLTIGSDVFIGAECYFEAVSEICIGNGVMIGPRVFCISGSHNYDSEDLRAVPYDNRQVDLPVVIEDNVWIAGNVSIAPGCHIGEGAVVGMGAVVAGEIPPYSVVIGGKGRVVKMRNVNKYKELVEQEKIYGRIFAGMPFEMIERDS